MNHRIPHYFTSVPTDSAPSQYNSQYVTEQVRPAVNQHHHRAVILEPQSQWSQAATSSPLTRPINLPQGRFQSAPADVSRTVSEDNVVSHFASASVTIPVAQTDWLNRPSTSSHYPPVLRHQATSSTNPDKRKHRHLNTATRQAKMRRVHCEEGGTADVPNRRMVMHGCTDEGETSSGAATSASYLLHRLGDHSYEDHHHRLHTIDYSQDGLPFPASVDGAALRMQTSPTLKDSSLLPPSVNHPNVHSYSHPKDTNSSASYSRVLLPSRKSVVCDLEGSGVKLAESAPRTLHHLENTLLLKHHEYSHNKEYHVSSQNRLMADSPDPAYPHPRSLHHSPPEHSQRLTKGCIIDVTKDLVPFPIAMESKNPPLGEEAHKVIDSSLPGYHKQSNHSCHLHPSTSSATLQPLSTFQSFPAHVHEPTPHNEPLRFPFTGSSLRENYGFSKHRVTAFHSKSQNSLSWDANNTMSQTQSEIAGNSHLFTQKSLIESSNPEAFNCTWHVDEINRPSTSHTIPAQSSPLCYSTNLEIHASSLSNPVICTSGSDKLQSDVTKTKAHELPWAKFIPHIVNQPDNSLASHGLVQQNFGASHISLSGTSDRTRPPVTTVSNCSRTTRSSTVISSPNTGTSPIYEIGDEGEDRIGKGNRVSPGPHSKTEPHTAGNPRRGLSSKILRDTLGKESMPQKSICTLDSKDSKGGTRRRRRHAVGLICGVCGDSARSLHFGGVSCDSCKAFFRRAVIAKAYPSFLCVTTGLPPNIQCQKSGKVDNESSKPSENRLAPPNKDSVQPKSNPKDPHKQVQIETNSGNVLTASNSAFKTVNEDERLSFNDSSHCSIPKSISPGSSSSSLEDGNSHSFSSACQNSSHSSPGTPKVHKTALRGKCSGVYDSGGKESELAANAKDAHSRLGLKKIVKCPPITITTRKYCQACRFQRCIDIGMEIGWVTLENDAQKNISNQQVKSNPKGNESRSIAGNLGGFQNEDKCVKTDKHMDKNNSDLKKYLTKEEQKQIEELIDIYRSVFWGVPEPAYYRPALIDFPPPFASSEPPIDASEAKDEAMQKTCADFKKVMRNVATNSSTAEKSGNIESTAPSFDITNSLPQKTSCRVDHEAPLHSSDSNLSQEADYSDGLIAGTNEQQSLISLPEGYCTDSENGKTKACEPAHQYFGIPYGLKEEETNPVSEMSIEEIISLPKDPQGVNMFRKPLMRRPRPWLIRQLMGYTLRFLNVVLKLLKSAGKSLSATDRTVLLRQGMTGLTFLNSVFTYDTDAEGWPERVFPPLPLVLQDDDSSASDQPEYLQGTVMHSDEVASVVPPDILECQLTFIRGMKTLIGNDCTSIILLMAIMLFDPTHEGLEHPRTVEKIQGNYCHLLKQYVGWKFKNGSPPNPGLGRPYNFAQLSSLPQEVNNSVKSAPVDELGGNAGAESRTMPEECNELSYSKDLPETLEKSEKKKHCDKNIFKFKRPEGMYYSPPYPLSPINPASIFPFLMTRMADLQQVAHGYSSMPFMLQGSEVDEIARLVARIEVFMSDIITATEPERDFSDEGGSDGGVGGSEGNWGTYEDVGSDASKPGKDTYGGDFVGHESLEHIFGGESLQHDKITVDNETDWDCTAEQEFDWESYSSGDDSNSISSQNAMGIGSSFNDLVGVLQPEGKKLRNCMDAGPESFDLWVKDDPISNFHETEARTESIATDDITNDEKVQLDALEINRSVGNLGYHPTHDNYDVQPIKNSQDKAHLGDSGSNMQHMKLTTCGGNDSVPPSNYLDTQSVIGASDVWDKSIYGSEVTSKSLVKVNQNKLMDRDENVTQWERAIREQSSFIIGREKPPEHSHNNKTEKIYSLKEHVTQKKDFQYPSSGYGVGGHSTNTCSRQEVQNDSLWDWIKATGKALLGIDSSSPPSPQGSFYKGGSNVSEQTTVQECVGDLENWLNPLERPDSNSSGYVSTVSSPPLPLNSRRELDAYDSGGDWEDLFQKL